MKAILEYLHKGSGSDEDTIMLDPEQLKAVLDFVKGNENKGVILRYVRTPGEWAQLDACYYKDADFYDNDWEKNKDKAMSKWPWKKIHRYDSPE